MVTLAVAAPAVARSAPSATSAERKSLPIMTSSQDVFEADLCGRLAHVAVAWPPARAATIPRHPSTQAGIQVAGRWAIVGLRAGLGHGRIPALLGSTRR